MANLATHLLAPAWDLFSRPFLLWNRSLTRDFFSAIKILQRDALRNKTGLLYRRIRYFRYFTYSACILYHNGTTLQDCFPDVISLEGFANEILKHVEDSIFPSEQLPSSSIKEFQSTAPFPVIFSWNSGYWRDRTTDQGIKKRSFILNALRSGAFVFL